MCESERGREKQTGGNGERRRGRSEKHVYLLWIDIGCKGFPSGEVPKVKRGSERQSRRETKKDRDRLAD